jgi:hypothetical protein
MAFSTAFFNKILGQLIVNFHGDSFTDVAEVAFG